MSRDVFYFFETKSGEDLGAEPPDLPQRAMPIIASWGKLNTYPLMGSGMIGRIKKQQNAAK